MNDSDIGPRPTFLDRLRTTVAPMRRQRKRWRLGKAGKVAAARDRQKRAQESARGPVLAEGYRADVLYGPTYEADEPIKPEEY